LVTLWNYIEGAKPKFMGQCVIQIARFSTLKHGVLDSDFQLKEQEVFDGNPVASNQPETNGSSDTVENSPKYRVSEVSGRLRMKLEWQVGARGRTSEMVYQTIPVRQSEDTHRSILSSNLFAPETALATDPPQYDILFKLIIIGDSGVGKSNILSRWITGKYSQNIMATVNVEFASKSFECEGKIVKLQLWDTAGQERYKAITRQYYRGAHGAVVVYDVTKANTYTHVTQWLEDIKEFSQNEHIQILLIGNKIDLDDQKAVDTQEALEFSKKHSINYLETSALDGSNCAKAMQMILQDIYTIYIQLEASKPKSTPKKITLSTKVPLNLDDLVDDTIRLESDIKPNNNKKKNECQC